MFKYFGLGWLLKFDFGVVPKKYLQIFTISYILILFRSLFSIYHSVLYASQKTHYKCFLEAVSYFVLFLLILLCKNLEITSEKLFVLYFFYLFILEFVCFLTFIKISKIQLYLVSFSRIKSYLQELGVQSFFFWLQNLASLFLFSSLIYLVNLTTGTEAAGEFALVSRPFLLILGIHFMFLNPFWSALSDALYKKEFCWIRSIFWKGLFLSILLPVFACVFLQIFYKGLLLRWSGRFFENDLLIALLSLWTILYCVINYLSIYLNALSKINTQVLFLGVGALLLLFLGPFLGAKCSASGVVLVGILAALPLFFSNIKQVKKLILKNEKGFNR
ncbi:MAG: hypothetical protein S4CHLAM37_13270 [Chlamydiia bacterium]|nr:hypothetical protein [Chlamydiia bacterium]